MKLGQKAGTLTKAKERKTSTEERGFALTKEGDESITFFAALLVVIITISCLPKEVYFAVTFSEIQLYIYIYIYIYI